MTDNIKDPIEEAEIVAETPKTVNPSPPPVAAFDIAAYNATLEIVRRRIGILEKAKGQLKKLKEMYQDIFVNDAKYNEEDKLVKEAMKKRKDVQSQLAHRPEAADLNGKIKDLSEQIKDNEASLSDELMEYYKTAGVTEIEDENGQVQEFTIVIRLKPKKRVE